MSLKKIFISLLVVLFTCNAAIAESSAHSISINAKFDDNLKATVKPKGRFFLFLSTSPDQEPRSDIFMALKNSIFAINIENLDASKDLEITSSTGLQRTVSWSLDEVPEGTYYIQIVWDHDTDESRIDAPGNIYSKVQKVVITKSQEISLVFSEAKTSWRRRVWVML